MAQHLTSPKRLNLPFSLPSLFASVSLTNSTLVRTGAKSQLSPFNRFAKRLREDYDAVSGCNTTLGNGQTEGQINRLKMLKRQMYGRASMALLSRRFLLAR